jgi:hypothetical protein
MDFAALQARLTSHLGGEEDYELHTLADRTSAINEGYLYLSEEWELNTAPLPIDGSIPADFLSYATDPAQYNKAPAPLANQNDQPWGGRYTQAHGLISYFAAFRLFQDKGPEMYERSMYWKQLYDQGAERIKRIIVRRNVHEQAASNADDSTFAGLRSSVRFYMNTANMTLEEMRRKFPAQVVDAAIIRSYRDLTTELDLCIKVAEIALPPSQTPGVATRVNLPADFISPYPDGAFTISGKTVIGGAFPYGQTTTYAPSFSIGRDGVEQFVTVQNFGVNEGTLLVRYVAEPPPLVNQTDKPWQGVYPSANKLIIYRAMRDLLRGDDKTYNLSRFWQNEYDREIVAVKKMLRRFDMGQANRVKMGHQNDGPVGFIPINAGEGNKGTENG